MGSSRQAPVHVVAYDAAWPRAFAEEAARLSAVLEPWLVAPIEHIGSTAVPGLIAKPVIDIMAPVASLDASRSAIDAVRPLEYVYFPYKTEVMHWFCKPSDAHRTHHLHLIPYGSALWRDRVAFRDALRSDAKLASEYADLKRDLAARFEFDREAYTQAKGPFVARVFEHLRRARESD